MDPTSQPASPPGAADPSFERDSGLQKCKLLTEKFDEEGLLPFSGSLGIQQLSSHGSPRTTGHPCRARSPQDSDNYLNSSWYQMRCAGLQGEREKENYVPQSVFSLDRSHSSQSDCPLQSCAQTSQPVSPLEACDLSITSVTPLGSCDLSSQSVTLSGIFDLSSQSVTSLGTCDLPSQIMESSGSVELSSQSVTPLGTCDLSSHSCALESCDHSFQPLSPLGTYGLCSQSIYPPVNRGPSFHSVAPMESYNPSSQSVMPQGDCVVPSQSNNTACIDSLIPQVTTSDHSCQFDHLAFNDHSFQPVFTPDMHSSSRSSSPLGKDSRCSQPDSPPGLGDGEHLDSLEFGSVRKNWSSVDKRVDAVQESITALDAKLNEFNVKLHEVELLFTQLEASLAEQADRFETIVKQNTVLADRITELENKAKENK